MQRTRSKRTSTYHSTLASKSSTTNPQKANKQKESENEQQPDVVNGTSNKKMKTKGALKVNSVLNPTNEEAPWENFEPFSASKTSWMLQELYSEVRENRRIMNQMQQEIHIQSLAEKDDKNVDAEPLKPTTPSAKASTILPVTKYPLETMESVDELEAQLDANAKVDTHLISLLLSLPRPNSHQFLFNILNFLMDVGLAAQFTYHGKAPCRSFKSLFLFEVIKKTVMKKFPSTGENFFPDRINAWLKGCKKKHARKVKQQSKPH